MNPTTPTHPNRPNPTPVNACGTNALGTPPVEASTAPGRLNPLTPGESDVLAACAAAQHKLGDAALAALIAGQFLSEYRDSLIALHGENRFAHGGRNRPEADQFTAWLERQHLTVPTAYRWMDAARRVTKMILGVSSAADLPPGLEVGRKCLAYSHALTAPETDLPPLALKFRHALFRFMADKTLREAVSACVTGESDPKRITLAAGGKQHGGSRGEDRKNFPLFISKNLLAFTGNLKNWDKWRDNHPAQHAHIAGIVTAFVNGGRVPTTAEGHLRDIEAWPLSFCELLADALKTRLKRTRQ